MRVSGLILAGGMGRRMQGQDKGWIELNSKPLISVVVEKLQSQVDEVVINANRNISRYQTLNKIIIKDELGDFQGPLAGMLSGLKNCQSEFMAVVPCDCPFFPIDLVKRFLEKQKATHADIVSVNDGTRTHPVFALIKRDLLDSLNGYLCQGERKIDRWYELHNYQIIEYPDGEHYFENINTPEQLSMINKRINNHDN